LSEEDERMLREELKTAANEKDYTTAVAKAEQIASYYEEVGNAEAAREAWIDAAKLFFEWAQSQRRGSSHKQSAKSMVNAANIFARLGIDAEAAQAIDLAAQDLLLAGAEYLVWRQPLGSAVCYSTAAILFILVSQEEKAQRAVDEVRTRLDALRGDSMAISLIDLPVHLKFAKNQLDSRTLNNIKTMVYSSLIPALNNAGLGEFIPYVERTITGIESFINANLQFPILEHEIKLAGEVLIDEPFDIQVLVTNSGEGAARDVELEMVPKKEVTVIRDFSKLKVSEIQPESAASFAWRCIVKSENTLQETQEINLSARLSFTDPKNMRQTLTVGPIAFSTISPKEQDQIRVEIRAVKDNIQKTREELLVVAASAGEEIFTKTMDIFEQLLSQAEGFIEAGAVQNAKAWCSLLQLQLELMKDIPSQIKPAED